jgi:outer membrane protease
MTNIGKITLFVIFICLFLSSVRAEEKLSGYGFSVVPVIGMLNGQADEIVYESPRTDHYISELKWDLKPVFYAGLAADFGRNDIFAKHGFAGSLSFKFGFPQNAGNMVDRDWLYEDSNALTNYSRHDNYLNKAILADLSLGYSFPFFNFIALGICLDFSYMHFSWTASDGYYQYLDSDKNGNILPGQTWNNDIPKKYLEGKVLNYSQDWYIFSPGVFIKVRVSRLFSLEGNFNYSPFIRCDDRDDHLLTNKTYFDNLYDGHFFRGGGSITFSPINNDLNFSLFLSYCSITGSRGDTYLYSVKYPGIAGGGYSAFDIGLSARIRLYGRK